MMQNLMVQKPNHAKLDVELDDAKTNAELMQD